MSASSRSGWRKAAGLAILTAALGAMSWTDSSAAPRIRAGNAASDAAAEEEPKTDPKILAKLDKILDNQQAILNRLDQVMEELKIVKIRATVR